jgi:hypothetical protein
MTTLVQGQKKHINLANNIVTTQKLNQGKEDRQLKPPTNLSRT